jgi:hypothetical protein
MSDPTSLQIPLNQALTSDMLLGLKPSAPKSRSYRINIAPINKNVFTPLDQIVFELPTGRRGTWLDQSQSYLKFSVQFASTAAVSSAGVVTNNFNTGNTGIYLENSAYSFFQRLDIYHASNLLESINEYGQLANFLIDTSLTQSDKAGLSTLIGCNGVHNMVTSVNVGAPTANSALNGNITVLQMPGDRSGQSVTSVTISSGISIIHINTEIRIAYKEAIEKYLKENPNEVAPYKILEPAVKAIEEVVYNRLKLFNNLS